MPSIKVSEKVILFRNFGQNSNFTNTFNTSCFVFTNLFSVFTYKYIFPIIHKRPKHVSIIVTPKTYQNTRSLKYHEKMQLLKFLLSSSGTKAMAWLLYLDPHIRNQIHYTSIIGDHYWWVKFFIEKCWNFSIQKVLHTWNGMGTLGALFMSNFTLAFTIELD